jgi:hypothetical protein
MLGELDHAVNPGFFAIPSRRWKDYLMERKERSPGAGGSRGWRLFLDYLVFCLVLPAVLAGPAIGRTENGKGKPSSIEALDNTDIVRMTISGISAEEILRRIRRGPARFDVDPEMQQELRRAGVEQAVIDGMVEVMRAAGPRRERPPIAETPRGFVEIVFEDDPEKSPGTNSILVPAMVRKPGSLRDAEPIALGFAVTCNDPVHVPDAWQYISPLDGTFRRHKLLFFQEETAQGVGKKNKDLAYMKHPGSWRFEVNAGTHRGAIAVVGRPGWSEKFALLAGDEFTDILVSPGLLTRFYVKVRSLTPRERQKLDDDLVKVLPNELYRNISDLGGRGARYAPLLAITKVDVPVPLETEVPERPEPANPEKEGQ